MASKNFPGPNINRIIEDDPQIISQGNKQYYDWGTRPSIFGRMSSHPGSNKPSQPSAPEMGIKHVGNK